MHTNKIKIKNEFKDRFKRLKTLNIYEHIFNEEQQHES